MDIMKILVLRAKIDKIGAKVKRVQTNIKRYRHWVRKAYFRKSNHKPNKEILTD